MGRHVNASLEDHAPANVDKPGKRAEVAEPGIVADGGVHIQLHVPADRGVDRNHRLAAED